MLTLPLLSLFASSALALTTLTFTTRSNTTDTFILGETTAWFDVESTQRYIDIATVSVETDHSEVAACYVSSNSIAQSKWVYSSEEPAEFGGTDVKYITCQENFELPSWIGEGAITTD